MLKRDDLRRRVVWLGKHKRMAEQHSGMKIIDINTESNKKLNEMIRRQSKKLLCLGRKGWTVLV